MDATTLAWDAELPEGVQVTLVHTLDTGLELAEGGGQGGEALELSVSGALPDGVRAKFPHLSSYTALTLTEGDAARAPELLRGQLALIATDVDGVLLDVTGVQIPGVLDNLYAETAYDEPLGVVWDGGTPTLRLWAPTA